jgi:cysteine synthase A
MPPADPLSSSESRFTSSGLRVADDALALIAHTPLVALRRVSPEGCSVVAKAEFLKPAGSVNDRPALSMIL